MKIRVAYITKELQTDHKDFNTKDEADEWLLNIMEKQNIKRYKIKNMDTGEVIETEQGIKNKKNCWEE